MKHTIIFDLDGTLLNTIDDLAAAVNHVMAAHGFPVHTVDHVRELVGNGISLLVERAIPGGKDNPLFSQCLLEFREYYQIHMQDFTAPFDGIRELLLSLRQRGCHIGVVSNKFDAAVKNLCRDYFGDLIEVAIGETATVARKPAPDTVLTAIAELGVKKEDCLYVGDSDVDIETARNSDIPCISVSWGFRSRDFLLAHGAGVIIDRPMQLLDCLS